MRVGISIGVQMRPCRRLRSSEDSAKPVLDYFGCLSSGIAEIVEFDCISIVSGLAFRQNRE
jgi:hypothetical protein